MFNSFIVSDYEASYFVKFVNMNKIVYSLGIKDDRDGFSNKTLQNLVVYRTYFAKFILLIKGIKIII